MDYETEGNFYAVWKIQDDLKKEKERLINSLYDVSTSMWNANASDYSREETARISARVEEITKILDGIRLGYYKEP